MRKRIRWFFTGLASWLGYVLKRLGILILLTFGAGLLGWIISFFLVVTPYNVVTPSEVVYKVDCSKIGAVIHAVEAVSNDDSKIKSWGFDSKNDRRFQAIDAALQQRLKICHK